MAGDVKAPAFGFFVELEERRVWGLHIEVGAHQTSKVDTL